VEQNSELLQAEELQKLQAELSRALPGQEQAEPV